MISIRSPQQSPSAAEHPHLSRMVGLAALSITDSLLARRLSPQIKWPNDILLNGRKVAGILIESVWSGENVDCIVIGMGVNILKSTSLSGTAPFQDVYSHANHDTVHILAGPHRFDQYARNFASVQ